MQRHKIHHPHVPQAHHMADVHHEPSEPTASPEDAFLKDEAMLFGQDVPPVAEEQPTTPPNPAPETADVSDVVEGVGGMSALVGESLEDRYKAEMEDMRLRAAAEMENFKKRLTREHQEQMRYAAEKVMADLLPTLDNLDLALQYGSKNEACKDMLQGVAMTQKLLLDAVAKHGLQPVGTEGEAFDPSVHEAVGFEEKADCASQAVARVLQHGYKLGDRLLRPAKVMVTP